MGDVYLVGFAGVGANILLNLVDYQITAVRDNIIVDSTNFTLARGGN